MRRMKVPSGRWRLAALVAVLALLGGALAWIIMSTRGLPDDAAFRTEGKVVTKLQVDRRVKSLVALYGVQRPTDPKELDRFKRDAAKSMAVQRILVAEAKAMGVVVPQREVATALGRLVAERYPDGGRTAFTEALAVLGASEAQVRREIADQLLVAALFDKVADDVTVPESELRSAFATRKEALATPELRQISNIVVADRRTAAEALRELQEGRSFTDVAAARSLDQATRARGGDLGAVAADDLEPDYAKVAFAARQGAFFGPVQTQYGWNIGVVRKMSAPVPARYEQIKDQLRQVLESEKGLASWRAWLRAVISRHDVEYAAEYRPAHPDALPDLGPMTGAPAPTGTRP